MRFGAHLPLIRFGAGTPSLQAVTAYVEAARDLGYDTLCANDHLVFQRAWLDGPTALAAALPATGEMRLATTVGLPVIRGPVAFAKSMAAMDVLAGAGRLTVAVGPGSSARDYAAVGVDFEERWKRLDESVRALRALWRHEAYAGAFYDTSGIELAPPPATPGGPPIWIGSWGSEAGLRRVARLADGWLASAYNTTPREFERARLALGDMLRARGRDPAGFPNALGTAWLYVADSEGEADDVLARVVAPMLSRPIDELRTQLPVGTPEHCATLLRAYVEGGAEQCFVWPLADDEGAIEQLERFRQRVVPLIEAT